MERYPKNHEEVIDQLSRYSELDSQAKIILKGEVMKQYGVVLSNDNVEMVKKYEQGCRDKEVMEVMQGDIELLDVDLEENIIHLEFMGEFLRINRNILDRINNIIKIKDKDERDKQYVDKTLSLIDEMKVVEGYGYNVDSMISMIINYDSISIYHRVGIESQLSAMINGAGLDMDNIEIRSFIMKKLIEYKNRKGDK